MNDGEVVKEVKRRMGYDPIPAARCCSKCKFVERAGIEHNYRCCYNPSVTFTVCADGICTFFRQRKEPNK